MIRMVERKVRERAQQLYEERGQVEGEALADWVQAESEILEGTLAASLYRRAKANTQSSQLETSGDSDLRTLSDSEAVCESV